MRGLVDGTSRECLLASDPRHNICATYNLHIAGNWRRFVHLTLVPTSQLTMYTTDLRFNNGTNSKSWEEFSDNQSATYIHIGSRRRSFLDPSCLALPCLALSCLALTCPALPCPALPCPALPCLALPYPVLSYPTLPCPTLPCPVLASLHYPKLNTNVRTPSIKCLDVLS